MLGMLGIFGWTERGTLARDGSHYSLMSAIPEDGDCYSPMAIIWWNPDNSFQQVSTYNGGK